MVNINKQRLILISIAIVAALIAVLMVRNYLEQQRRIIEKREKDRLAEVQANLTQVIVANKDLPEGSAITADVIGLSLVPNEFIQPGAVPSASLDRIIGKITIAPILKGEQITQSKLAWREEQRREDSLAAKIPIGKRAITISVDNISSLLGMIKPGNYVDVIALIPVPARTPDGKEVKQPVAVPLFQNVLVLAVGQQTSPVSYAPQVEASRYRKEEVKAAPVSASPLITLALTAQEANIIAFVQEQSKIRLILRGSDNKIDAIQPVSWPLVLKYLENILPKDSTVKSDSEGQSTEQVEIYRGLNKEIVPLQE